MVTTRRPAPRLNLAPLAITVPQAARLVGVSKDTAWAAVWNGSWPSVRIGRSVRIPLDALRAWIKRESRGPVAVDEGPK